MSNTHQFCKLSELRKLYGEYLNGRHILGLDETSNPLSLNGYITMLGERYGIIEVDDERKQEYQEGWSP